MWAQCLKCGKHKPFWAMKKNRRHLLVIDARCKQCDKEHSARYRKENPTKVARYWRQHLIGECKWSKEKAAQLTHDVDKPKKQNGYLSVVCTYCGRRIIPSDQKVRDRIKAINGTLDGEHRFYCSEPCKASCPIFWRQKYYKGQTNRANTREVNPELRQMALERDNYTCQSCGVMLDDKPLAAHHIVPVKADPTYEADLDNVVTLCHGRGSCHNEAHKKGWCKTGQLARLCNDN